MRLALGRFLASAVPSRGGGTTDGADTRSLGNACLENIPKQEARQILAWPESDPGELYEVEGQREQLQLQTPHRVIVLRLKQRAVDFPIIDFLVLTAGRHHYSRSK